MARAFVLMPVQAVTPIMSLAMTPLEHVVALVDLDHDKGRDILPLVISASANPTHCMNPAHD